MKDKNMTTAKMVRKDALELTGIDMPISGGSGFSRDDPIVIDDADPSRSAYWGHQVVGFVYNTRGEPWQFENATIEEHEGKTIEKFQISRANDSEQYYNFYFDITKSMG